jgi:hypothetical protein
LPDGTDRSGRPSFVRPLLFVYADRYVADKDILLTTRVDEGLQASNPIPLAGVFCQTLT